MSSQATRRWLKALVLGAALAAAVVAWRRRPHDAAFAGVDRGDVRLEALGTGTLESADRVVVAFTVGGRIASLSVDEGERVTAGQVLATLDTDEAARQVDVARANESLASVSIERASADVARARVTLDVAAQELERTAALSATGGVSASALDAARERHGRAQAEWRAASAALTQAKSGTRVAHATTASQSKRIEDGKVTSPFDGVVVQRVHAVGDVVGPGAPVFAIASTEKLRVRAWIDETQLPSLHERGDAGVVLRSEPARTLRGRVERIGLEADRQTHEVLVDVELLERPVKWALGQRADVALLLAARAQVTRAPRRFLDLTGRSCLVEREGRVARVSVVPGLIGNEWVEVTDGLVPGDTLLAARDGDAALFVGAIVRHGGAK